MKTITVQDASLNVNSGRVSLSGAQWKARAMNLKAVEADAKTGAGIYEVMNPIQFKKGETFGFDGETTKAGDLRDLDAERARLEKAAKESHEKLRAELERQFVGKLEEAAQRAEAELLAKLKPETAELVRAELEAAAEAAAKGQKAEGKAKK